MLETMTLCRTLPVQNGPEAHRVDLDRLARRDCVSRCPLITLYRGGGERRDSGRLMHKILLDLAGPIS